MNRIPRILPHFAAVILAVAPASAMTLVSEDFQSPALGNNTSNPGFSGWTWINGNAVKSRNMSQNDLPGDANFAENQALQFEWTSAEAHYDLSHNWASDDVFNLTLNAAPQAWNIHQQRYVRPRIVETTSNDVLWAPGEDASTMITKYGNTNQELYAWNGPGPYGNSGGGDIADNWQDAGALTEFSWTIDASTFTAGTPGENIRLELASSGDQRGIYIDNVSLALEAIPEPSGVALIGLGALGLMLRRRR